jgi:hypothetical protein
MITTGLDFLQYPARGIIKQEQPNHELKHMEHVWIMRTDGIVLFHKGPSDGFDCDLIAGFLSAVNVFASQIDESGLKEIELGNQAIAISKVHDLFFMIMHEKKVKAKKIAERLARMVAVFFELYPQEKLNAWRGNLSEFTPLNTAFAVIQ